jgi:hypothetical protein
MIKEIGLAIKTNLSTITGLTVYSPDNLPVEINTTPSLVILPPAVEYEKSFQADIEATFRLIILVAKQDQPTSLSVILPYIDITGSQSIRTALYTDRTLGGNGDCVLKLAKGTGFTQWGSATFLSTEFELFVISKSL